MSTHLNETTELDRPRHWVEHGTWRGFTAGDWCESIAVRDFIHANYRPYEGDASFLAGATERTTGRSSTRPTTP